MLLVIPFFAAASGSNDTLPSGTVIKSFPKWDPQLSLTGNLSQTGFSTALTGQARYRQVAFYAGGKIVHTKTYKLGSAPFGIVAGMNYFPNRYSGRFNGFINADYQLTLQGNAERSAGGHLVHEYTAGYGFYFMATERLHITSSINFGRYTEVMQSPYTGEKVTYSGYNNLLRLGLNYRLKQ